MIWGCSPALLQLGAASGRALQRISKTTVVNENVDAWGRQIDSKAGRLDQSRVVAEIREMPEFVVARVGSRPCDQGIRRVDFQGIGVYGRNGHDLRESSRQQIILVTPDQVD